MKTTWKAKLFEANETLPRKGAAATMKNAFAVDADGHDAARAAARAWCERNGYKVRSVNFSSTAPTELLVYVRPKR